MSVAFTNNTGITSRSSKTKMFKPDKIKINKAFKETTINVTGVFIDKNDWNIDSNQVA